MSTGSTPEVLRRLMDRRPPPSPGERCEMCSQSLAGEHSHVVDLAGRGLMCSCRACYLLFTYDGAAGGSYRAVPDRHRYDPAFQLTAAQWDALGIPVELAFFFHNSTLDRFVAFYPSPAGATESELPLDTWHDVLRANPGVADLDPDVEALLLRQQERRFECYLVPIDVCYDLVGRMRLHWRGFQGGEEVWREIDTFLAQLRGRSEAACGPGRPGGRDE
ncbi:MAG: DUF5947 family protein [Carbonactinosporaceae bacterium]